MSVASSHTHRSRRRSRSRERDYHHRRPSPNGTAPYNGSANRHQNDGWGPLPPTPPLPPPPPEPAINTVNTVSYAQQQVGASVTESMRRAYDECKADVARIAAQCRAKNRKFRDVEFDLENDSQRCLHNLSDRDIFTTADVRRISEIFANPVFYSGTPKSAEIVQGAVEDCYLVSALSTMTAVERLIKNLCVARDEEVGIYGFLFYRDCYWVPVLVDDLLFTRVPKWEQLSTVEKELYHFEKERYNATARKGSDSLYFARPTTEGETWVPLVEKAYAKVHGDYASVMFGRTCDAIEDMTGGVSNLILTKDILDPEKFWNEELTKANQDRLFGCWFKTLDGGRSGVKNATVDGLVGNLSHSVVKAVEIRGKRFIVLRDPWGEAGWEGPWSDGSKEWTTEWLTVLPELGHSFGGKGQFVMEYKDFLSVWQEVQRTLIFDDTWVTSSQWLHVSLPFPSVSAFSFGDISFSFSLPARSPVVIVFNKYNTRYFKDIQGPCIWNLDFILAKEGETEPLAESSYSFFYTRGVNIELDLEPGNYVVLGRLDPTPARDKDYFKKGLANGWDRRKLARIMTERAKGQSIASNYKPNPELLVTPVADILGSHQVKADKLTIDAVKTHAGYVRPGESITVTTTTTQVISKSGKAIDDSNSRQGRPHKLSAAPPLNGYSPHDQYNAQANVEPGWSRVAPAYPNPSPPRSPVQQYTPLPPPPMDLPRPASPPIYPLPTDVLEDDNSIVVGLKVFTKRVAPTVITGRLKDPKSRASG
ncbi:cysteine proteinase [Pholiota conissans]|uniref:Cysteine proteinase n=1 Tax=Pholiota conissans TaxID=109636 RepID=A0A9P5Z6K1_9AGAR|nr:cysteine proteinase [Pholiota conissans]